MITDEERTKLALEWLGRFAYNNCDTADGKHAARVLERIAKIEQAVGNLIARIDRDGGHAQKTGDVVAECKRAEGVVVELLGDIGERDALFDLQRKRMAEAIRLWRAENPKARELVHPDLGDLLEWLIKRGNT